MILVSNNTLDISYDLVDVGEGKQVPYIHTTVHSWSKDIMMNEIWPVVIDSLSVMREKGYDYVYTTSKHSNRKVRKFQEMFGFKMFYEAPEWVVLRRSTKVRST